MELIEIDDRTPPNGIARPVSTQEGVVLRAARWPPDLVASQRRQAPGTVLICTGQGEFIEKYYEVVAELRQRGLMVVIFDWRGQGLSGRALRNRRKGHIAHFDAYERDLAAVVAEVLEPFCPKPWFALAHSMGGTVALNFVAGHPEVFQRLVLSAPMIQIAGLPMPDMIRWITRFSRAIGLGRSFLPGRETRMIAETFADNILTSDPERYARMKAFKRADPRLAVGAPTFGWLHAAFEAMAALQQEGFVQSFRTPALFVVPGADRLIDPGATQNLARRLRASRTVLVAHARHEILMERDVFRAQFWAAFDAFIPGSG